MSTAIPLHGGSRTMPPMVQVSGEKFGLVKGVVKPPSAEDLWNWYEANGYAATDPDPSYGNIWDSAQHLALWLSTEVVAGKRCLELGCGVGIPGCVAAKLGATKTIFLDREGFALHMACATARLNELTVGAIEDRETQVAAIASDFQSARHHASSLRPDILLASDVLYSDAAAMDELADTCFQLLAPQSGTAYIADPHKGRAFGARDSFVDACSKRGASVQESLFPFRDSLEPTVLLSVTFSDPTTSE